MQLLGGYERRALRNRKPADLSRFAVHEPPPYCAVTHRTLRSFYMPTEATKHLNKHELASRWNCSVRTIEDRRASGELPPAFKSGAVLRWRLTEILAYEEANLSRSTSETAGDAG